MEFCGKGVSGGIAIGKAAVFERGNEQIRRISVDDAKAEMKRFSQAKKLAEKQLKKIYDKALIEVGETNAEIFNIHMMMLIELPMKIILLKVKILNINTMIMIIML